MSTLALGALICFVVLGLLFLGAWQDHLERKRRQEWDKHNNPFRRRGEASHLPNSDDND